jgi:hypothetical protein
VHGIGPKPRLIPEIHFTARGFCLFRNGRKPCVPPRLNRLGIALVSSLQRLLRRQPQLRKQFSYRRHAKPDVEFPRDQAGYHRPRPQPEIQAILTRIATIDPAKTPAAPEMVSNCVADPSPAWNAALSVQHQASLPR